MRRFNIICLVNKILSFLTLKYFFEKFDKFSIKLKSGKKIFLMNLKPINFILFDLLFSVIKKVDKNLIIELI